MCTVVICDCYMLGLTDWPLLNMLRVTQCYILTDEVSFDVFSRPTTMTMLRWRWRRWRETWQRTDWSTSTRLMTPVRMTYHWCIHLILTRYNVCCLLDSCVAQWLKWLKVVQAATTAGLRLLYIAVDLVAVFLVLTLTGQYWPRLWTWMTRLGQTPKTHVPQLQWKCLSYLHDVTWTTVGS